MAHLHGSETDNWIGKKVMLYVDMVDFKGDVVEAIRIKAAPRTAPVDEQRDAAIDERPAPVRRMPEPAQREELNDEIPF